MNLDTAWFKDRYTVAIIRWPSFNDALVLGVGKVIFAWRIPRFTVE